MSRMKLQVWGALSNLGSALPCGSLSSHKLPWVTGECRECWVEQDRGFPSGSVPDMKFPTVSHHDPEIPFNHSFIEPPSAGWASDDSFSSDPESGEDNEGPTYCVPPQEGSSPHRAPTQLLSNGLTHHSLLICVNMCVCLKGSNPGPHI